MIHSSDSCILWYSCLHKIQDDKYGYTAVPPNLVYRCTFQIHVNSQGSSCNDTSVHNSVHTCSVDSVHYIAHHDIQEHICRFHQLDHKRHHFCTGSSLHTFLHTCKMGRHEYKFLLPNPPCTHTLQTMGDIFLYYPFHKSIFVSTQDHTD